MTPKHTLKLKMFNAEKLSHAIGVPANGDLTQKQIDSICFNVDRLFSENYDRLKAENEKLRSIMQEWVDLEVKFNSACSEGSILWRAKQALKEDSPC